MTGPLVMFDSIHPAELLGLPAGSAYAGYVDGNWPTYNQASAAHPGAQVLPVAVSAADDAEGLDVENGDATPGQAPGWVLRQEQRGVVRPVVYASAETMPDVVRCLASAGIARRRVRLWSAHYDAGEHICGPGTCGYRNSSGLVVPACDATQWTDKALGRDLDQSLLLAGFFAIHTPPPRRLPPEDPVFIDLPAGAHVIFPVWEHASAAGLPTGASHATLVLAGAAGAALTVTNTTYHGKSAAKDYKLTGAAVLAGPGDLSGVAVVEIQRTDTAAAPASAVLSRW